jgi:hypothetical protein
MRRKTIIVLTLTFMVTVMVSAFSYLYISQILRLRATNVYDNASYLTQQLAYAATNAVPDLGSTPVDTGKPEAVRVALTEYLQTDVNLNSMLESVVGNWPFIYDASVVDVHGKALLNTNPKLVGKLVAERPDFRQVITARFRQQLQLVYGPHTVYNVSFPLQLNGQPFGTIRIGVSTAFLKDELTPRLMHALYFSIASIFGSLVLAAGISNLALGPENEERLQQACQQLAETAVSVYSVGPLDAANALSYVNDPAGVWWMEWVLQRTDSVDPILIRGLTRIGNAAAQAVLAEVAAFPDPDRSRLADDALRRLRSNAR